MGTRTQGTAEDNIGVSFVEEQQDRRSLGLPFIQAVAVTGSSAARELHHITEHPVTKPGALIQLGSMCSSDPLWEISPLPWI